MEASTAEKHIRLLIKFAYDNGFHEIGYDPVEQLKKEVGEQTATDLGHCVGCGEEMDDEDLGETLCPDCAEILDEG